MGSEMCIRDRSLNTPLHIAVDAGVASIVTSLLEHGADPTQRNLRGDVPSQFFMFPKLHLETARICRKWLLRSSRQKPAYHPLKEEEPGP